MGGQGSHPHTKWIGLLTMPRCQCYTGCVSVLWPCTSLLTLALMFHTASYVALLSAHLRRLRHPDNT